MAEVKEVAKKTKQKTVTFISDNLYEYIAGVNIQFRQGIYKTSDIKEIQFLTDRKYLTK